MRSSLYIGNIVDWQIKFKTQYLYPMPDMSYLAKMWSDGIKIFPPPQTTLLKAEEKKKGNGDLKRNKKGEAGGRGRKERPLRRKCP